MPDRQNSAFYGHVITKWEFDEKEDRVMTLMEDFEFVDKKGETWIARQGNTINGASIPKPL